MSNYWAVAVGINHYQFLQPLHFAQPDAQSLCESLVGDAGFLPEHCLLVTDASPEFAEHSTDPTSENLRYWTTFLKDKLQPEDGLWYFFSGYGICVDGEDYLLPIDGDVTRIKETGISVRSLLQTLKALPTQRILLLLDINRSTSVSNEKVGAQTAALASEYGIPTVLSCRPEQFSHETPALNHGLFTQALLEGLRSHQCSTLAMLEDFLKTRLPELCDHSDRPIQDSVLIVSDPEQLYQVIMPVNWAETESWAPVTSNPFAVEGDLYLDPLDLDYGASDDLDVQPTTTGTTTEIPENLMLNPIEYEPIHADLSLPDAAEPSAQLPAPLPPSATVSPIPEAPSAPDQMFWERLLFGGSAILLVLLLGILFRNWSTFTGSQQTANSNNGASSAPTAVASPNAASNSDKILNEARSYIKPALASDANRAIERARTIPSTDPRYAEAQQEIDRWSRNILEIARKRAEQKEFQQAIAAAQLVPKDRPQVYAEAQKAIQQWRKAR